MGYNAVFFDIVTPSNNIEVEVETALKSVGKTFRRTTENWDAGSIIENIQVVTSAEHASHLKVDSYTVLEKLNLTKKPVVVAVFEGGKCIPFSDLEEVSLPKTISLSGDYTKEQLENIIKEL